MTASRRRGGEGATRRPRRRTGPVRPTAARVRRALFDSLGARVAGAAVLDLFAGTGALGIEAINRGARRVVFVERDPARCSAIRAAVPAGPSDVEVVCADALVAVARMAARGDRFDLVLLDPPYGRGWLDRALAAVREAGLLAPEGLAVAEGHWRDAPAPAAGFEVIRHARYGETALWYVRIASGREAGGGRRVRIAVYPGSFDPVHHGHIELIRRATKIFDHVIVAVAENVEKIPGAFPLEERVAMMEEVLDGLSGVEVAAYRGLTVEFALARGATCVIKGLRAVGDFDYELKQSAMNRILAPGLDTLLFIADPQWAFVSSSLIREVARLGGAVDAICPPAVVRRLRQRWPAQG
ncbi:MAG: pantetheine-phosphate adenylyltransferase [Armatimonadota bacterium]|nr:pantetheine-phosphate adenylyltransferase [Armatimonadota bacterium]MDR7453601.1 pantetheine-phosphate adenylyltransferase [Armatimonadota bacterium]MDR7456919.1 pantetheine-phosphate adenylyltransferase [Armatimonadota bacterium]MDR7496775.1 pantetheine-phosphate adenylyltransferase [Armatimonadota bacterium]MDR7511219.1 pantetheine-phosphate adenylyltransferase [Armatimonadota bacterium]